MVTESDLIFGEIAIKTGLVTAEQIDECIKIQQSLTAWKPIGLVLLEKKYLSEEQLQTIIDIQRRNLEARAIQVRHIKEDNIFGRLAVKLGLLTEQEVEECLGVQLMMQDDYFLRLGEIMVNKGYLSQDDVDTVLDYQSAQIIHCPKCQTKYNVILFNPGSSFICYECDKELIVPDSLKALDM
ncbi:MAG: hypothetical protein KAS70_05820 [Planctomycetes bacterium]|nr:hypothetical protein [Planctomycetota bacterium]